MCKSNGRLETSFLKFSSLQHLPFSGAQIVLVITLLGFFLHLERSFFVFDQVSAHFGGPESISEFTEISSQQIPIPL